MTLEPLALQNMKTGQIYRVKNDYEFKRLTGLDQHTYDLMLFKGLQSVNNWDNLKLCDSTKAKNERNRATQS